MCFLYYPELPRIAILNPLNSHPGRFENPNLALGNRSWSKAAIVLSFQTSWMANQPIFSIPHPQ